MLQDAPAEPLWSRVAPLLRDANRGVRMKAVSLLAAVPTSNQPPADRQHFEDATAEFVAAQRLNADRPEARTTLGHFYARLGRTTEAEAEYRAALRLSPEYTPAAVNLADLFRQLGKDRQGEGVLRTAIEASPGSAELHYALGLALVRLKQADEAVTEFHRAADLEPGRARYIYVYAVGLHSSGHGEEALAVLKDGLAKHREDREILLALSTFNRDAGDLAAALGFAEQLARVAPDDHDVAGLVQSLRREGQKTGAK
jgi:Flp pilus assembly protein TadD